MAEGARELGEVNQRALNSQVAKMLEIEHMMSSHFDYMRMGKNEWLWMRSLAFFWHLGANIASAGLNLTQIPIFTWSHLAAAFGPPGVGDVEAAAQLLKEIADLRNFRTTGKISRADTARMHVLNEAVQDGKIKETFAAEVAGINEGSRFAEGMVGSGTRRVWHHLKMAGASAFSLAEQVNRRVTFMAAFTLAMRHPKARRISEAVAQHQTKMEELRAKGWSDKEARAYAFAIETVELSQGVYSKEGRAAFVRGKLGSTVFVFYTFPQQMIHAMWADKAVGVRAMLLIMLMSGLMGLPGMDDLFDLVKTAARKFFHTDFNPELELRKWMNDQFGLEGDGWGDFALHGAGRFGFGWPMLLAAMGADFLPEVDRGRAVGFGSLLPFKMSDVFPTDPAYGAENVARGLAGASLGVFWEMYRAIGDSRISWGSAKKWESFVPGALGHVMHAFRMAAEGGETNTRGDIIMESDTSDPIQRAELIAVALGYQPTRLARIWDNTIMRAEIETFWDIQKEFVLRRLFEALRDEDEDARLFAVEAIREYNERVPDEFAGKRLTSETVEQSMQQRFRQTELIERGLPGQLSNIGIDRMVDELIPTERVIEQRPVR